MFRSFVLLLMFTYIKQVFCDIDCKPCRCMDESNTVIADCRGLASVTQKINVVPVLSNSQIKVIRLEYQLIHTLPNNVFVNANIGEIEQINMDFGKLNIIEKGAFKNITKLKSFSAANNNISQLLVGTFDDNIELERLNLSDNNIKELNNGLFDSLVNLKELNIRNNHIWYIGNELFKNNSKLTELNLSNNKLEYVDGNVLQNLNPKLKLLIHGNSWNCNCSLWKFYSMSLKHLKNAKEIPECSKKYTSRNKKLAWKQLTPDHFACKPNITIHISNRTFSTITLLCKIETYSKLSNMEWCCNRKGKKHPKSSIKYKYINGTFIYYISLLIETKSKRRFYTCTATQFEKSFAKNVTRDEIEDMVNNNDAKDQINEEMNTEMMEFISSDAMNIDESPEIKSISFADSKQLECSSDNPTSILWFFRGFNIDKDVIKRAGNKYEIKTETNKSVLVINNVLAEDQGLYECRNSLKNTKWYVNGPTAEEIPLLAIVLGTIFLVLLIGFIIMLCYFLRRNNAEMKNSVLNRSVNRNSANEYVTNKNEYMEESSIYVSSDNNIYEDIIYGPVTTK